MCQLIVYCYFFMKLFPSVIWKNILFWLSPWNMSKGKKYYLNFILSFFWGGGLHLESEIYSFILKYKYWYTLIHAYAYAWYSLNHKLKNKSIFKVYDIALLPKEHMKRSNKEKLTPFNFVLTRLTQNQVTWGDMTGGIMKKTKTKTSPVILYDL